MNRSRIERISITLPADLVRYADREARRLGRPRSWVIAEALRTLAGPRARVGDRVVDSPVVSQYSGAEGELDQARHRRLRAALALSPGERLSRAHELVRLARAARPRRARTQVVAFDTFEEFWQWKKAHRAGAAGRS
jgi:hypothetical protein